MLDSSESQLFQVPGSERTKLEQVVQAVSNSILTVSKGRESTDSEQCIQHPATLTLKKYFYFLYQISAFQSVPVAFCPVTGFASYLEILALSSCSLPIKYFSMQLRVLSEFSSTSSPSSLSFSSLVFIAFKTFHCTQFRMSMCLLEIGGQNWTQHSRSTSPGLVRGERSHPSTCWQHLWSIGDCLKAHCWLMFNLWLVFNCFWVSFFPR